MSEEITRGEFNLLKDLVQRNQDQLQSMDRDGTRGFGVLQNQIIDLLKDLTELKISLDLFRTTHLAQHEKEVKDRQSGRHWLIGMGIAGIASMSAVGTLIIEVLIKVHG